MNEQSRVNPAKYSQAFSSFNPFHSFSTMQGEIVATNPFP
jgi:hypothetical protein